MAKKVTGDERLVFLDQLRAVLGDLQVGVFAVDPDRKITAFNHAAELLTGYGENEVVGRFCHEVFQNELCQGECKYHEAVEAEQSSLSFELEITDRYREKRTITKIVAPLYNLRRELVGCLEVFQDRSAFKELINRIQYSEKQLKLILESLDIGVFTVTRSGLITFFNGQAEKVSGFRRQEVLGRPCSIMLGDEETIGFSALRKSIEDGKPRSNKKGMMTTKDGRTIPIRADYMALRNEQGRIIGGLATIQDLSLIDQLNRAISSKYALADMVGKEPSIQKVFEMVPVVAESEATVLIEGPTGTGKDLLAKVIHNASRRAQRPMVKVNCAALPDNLLESEMFGYVKGAFTGADRDKPGRFQEADGGTIFLDEIGDLPLSLQAKLLRVLEDKEFYSLGSRKTTKVDVRIIAATNQGLGNLVEARKFREDLFYRLNVIRIDLPPLRERRGDIPLLIEHVVRRLAGLRGARTSTISEDAMEILLNYNYPGNVRELENILEHALILCRGEAIEPRHLPAFLRRNHLPEKGQAEPNGGEGPASERERILEALMRRNWRRGEAAQELHMDRTTLWRKIKRYNLAPSRPA